MILRIIFLLASIIGLAGTSAYGAWASGGGLVYNDALNPWFLENTKEVHYCIDIDEAQFGVSARTASFLVAQALKEWKTTFEQTTDDFYLPGELEPYGQVRVGTQTFVEVDCSDHVGIDLRFQLGRLTSEQMSYFDDLSSTIGIAVRTHYDVPTMKARGFIYLSPVSGPLIRDHPRIHPDAWEAQDHFALRVVLLHELGHIFGIGHIPNTLMDHKAPEMVVDRVFMQYLNPHGISLPLPPTLFVMRDKWIVEGCVPGKNPVLQPSFFKRSDDPNACGRLTLEGNRLLVEYRENKNSVYEAIALGTIRSRSSSRISSVNLYLPAGQRVFTKTPNTNRLFGETASDFQSWSGTIEISATGERFPIKISRTIEGFETSIVAYGEFRDYVLSLSP